MANIQSQIKRNRQNEKRRLRNRDFRGSARTAVKNALAAMTEGQDAPAAVAAAITSLDKAARKGAIHHRNAARRKSRLIKRLAAIGQRPVSMPAQPAEVPSPAESKSMPVAKSGKRPAAAAEPKVKPEARKSAPKTAAKKVPAKKPVKK